MTTSIDGVSPTIVTIDPNSNEIVVMSASGPAGPQGLMGPPGAAFEGNAIALINPETDEPYLPGEYVKVDLAAVSTTDPITVTGSLEVSNLSEIVITVPPIEVEFPPSFTINNANSAPIPVAIISGGGSGGGGEVTIAPDQTIGIEGALLIDSSTPIAVAISGGVSTFDGQLFQGGNAVSSSNRLYVDVEFPAPQPVELASGQSVGIEGLATVTPDDDAVFTIVPAGDATFPVTLSGSPTVRIEPGIDPIVVTIEGGGPGGDAFDGQLTQAGNAVSSANRLYVDVGTLTVTVSSVTAPLTIDSTTPVAVSLDKIKVEPESGSLFDVRVNADSVVRVMPDHSGTVFKSEIVNTIDANVTFPSVQGVEIVSTAITPTNRSSTITTGGAAQALMASNSSRKGFWLQNLSAGDLYFSVVGTASAGGSSIKLASGALYETPLSGVPGTAVSIFGATTGQAFSSNEW